MTSPELPGEGKHHDPEPPDHDADHLAGDPAPPPGAEPDPAPHWPTGSGTLIDLPDDEPGPAATPAASEQDSSAEAGPPAAAESPAAPEAAGGQLPWGSDDQRFDWTPEPPKVDWPAPVYPPAPSAGGPLAGEPGPLADARWPQAGHDVGSPTPPPVPEAGNYPPPAPAGPGPNNYAPGAVNPTTALPQLPSQGPPAVFDGRGPGERFNPYNPNTPEYRGPSPQYPTPPQQGPPQQGPAPMFDGRGPGEPFNPYNPNTPQYRGPGPQYPQQPPQGPPPGYRPPPPPGVGHTTVMPQLPPEPPTGPTPAPGYVPAPPEPSSPWLAAPAPGASGSYGAQPLRGFSGPTHDVSQSLRQEAFGRPEEKPKPRSGWRVAILRGSVGVINPGESKREREEREWTAHIQSNMAQDHFVYMTVSPRGGVSKTTTTVGTASTFSLLRGSEVVAVDCNPAAGTLASRINPDATASFVDLLTDRGASGHLNRIRKYTKLNNISKLDVLAAPEQVGGAPPEYTPDTLRQTVDVLKTGYRIIALDTGNDLHSDLVNSMLDLVQAVVVVTNVGYDGGKAAEKVFNWLNYYHPQLISRSFLVMSARDADTDPDKRRRIEEVFASTPWKDPSYIPHDEHLLEATEINFTKLQKPTQRAYLEVTNRLSQWYGHPPLPRRRPA